MYKRQYYLRFSFTETVILSDTHIAEQIICAVDLGINTDAVCSIMKADGTILARKFIDFTSDKDRMIHAMNRTRRKPVSYTHLGLEPGTYTLKETKAPAGHYIDEKLYDVVVNKNGTFTIDCLEKVQFGNKE